MCVCVCIEKYISSYVEVHIKAFCRACIVRMSVCLLTTPVCILTVGLGDPIDWWWIVRVTGLEATPIVKQLSDTKSVCARLV